jgi:hypothetical protein
MEGTMDDLRHMHESLHDGRWLEGEEPPQAPRPALPRWIVGGLLAVAMLPSFALAVYFLYL